MKKKKKTSISPHLADKILLEKSLNGGGSVVLPLTNSLSNAHLMEKRAHESGIFFMILVYIPSIISLK